MPSLDAEQLAAYRARTFRLLPQLRLQTPDDAVYFVNQRGFVYLWPIKGVNLPSLWTAVAGDRPVAAQHDDPGHITWGWKDDMLDKRQWYYAKVLRGKATAIALRVAPYFYALSESYGDPEHDYEQLYADGLLSRPARDIYRALLRHGALDTVNLRRKVRMTSKSSDSRFARGLTELQRDFKILPVGVAQTGSWRYSFIYELVHRHYPDLPAQSRPITRQAARQELLRLYLDSVGAATESDARRLFQWTRRELQAALQALVEAKHLQAGYSLANQAGEHFVSAALLDAPR
jgi:hypothetical protein